MSYYDQGQVPSLDEVGSRKGIIPAEVNGFWKKRRLIVQGILMLVLLILPWTRFAGQQTVLLDITHRKFTFFGVTLWAHEAPLLFLVLITSVLGLFFVTSVWGRIWCGWACPQTVFIDFVYRRIEIWIEGSYLQRRKYQTEDWPAEVYFKKILKWVVYFILSSLFAHSVAAYFLGSHELVKMIQSAPGQNWTYFVMISFLTGLLLFNFGWFREQFCLIVCPYGRFQSALLDSRSLVVAYDAKRGEPRKGANRSENEAQGDCVSCNRCVNVCPTGIDIRYGLQMECIACTACIDACDEIMEKVKKPKGLIRYGTLSGKGFGLKRARPMIYFTALIVVVSVLIILLSRRSAVDISVLRAKEIPFTIQVDEKGEKIILNHLIFHIKNQSNQAQSILIRLPQDEIKQVFQNDFETSENLLKAIEQIQVVIASNPVELPAGQDQAVHVFFKVGSLIRFRSGALQLPVEVNGKTQKVTLLGPAE